MNEEPRQCVAGESASQEESSEADVSEMDTATETGHFERKPFQKVDFDPNEWELVEEDNCLVELHGVMRKNFLKNCDKDRVKIIGLFDPDGKAFLQLDDVVFVGEPTDSFGTNVLFEKLETESVSSDDENTFKTKTISDKSKKKTKLEYFGHTDKKLSMYRALLVEKDLQSRLDSTADT